MELKSRIIEMPEPLGLYAGQLFARGEEYLEAFRRLSEHDGQMMHATYFMMAHAFEVLLKSFLAASGVSKKELQHRQLGHNLENIYAKCVALDIPPIANIEAFAREITEKNRGFDFRYPSDYNLRLPRRGVLGSARSARRSIARSDHERTHSSADQVGKRFEAP